MSPLQLLTSVLAVAAVTAAAPVSKTSRANVCKLLFLRDGDDPEFQRITLSGTKDCRCTDKASATCGPLKAYPTVAPNSPDALLHLNNRPSLAALPHMLAFQIQQTCYFHSRQGRRCSVTWPRDGSSNPVCDCAKEEKVTFRVPHFVDDIRSRMVSLEDEDVDEEDEEEEEEEEEE